MLRRLVLSIALLILATPLASADTGYRYWGYFQAQSGASSWTAAMTGPTIEVKDGDVEGWAFVASSNDIPATPPMMDPDFAALCGEVSEVAGKVRVGLVVDFGAGEIAPEGDTPNEFFSDCVLVPEGSIGLDVLNAVLDVRADDSGLICGIAGYPSAECGAEIDMSVLTSSESPMVTSDKPEESGTSTLSMGLLATLAVTIGLIALRRRSK